MRRFPSIVAIVTLLVCSTCAQARGAIGETAVRGDNCTTYNNLAIGIPVPGAGVDNDIVNQSALLDHGWRILGWIITGQDGRNFFTPYRSHITPASGVVFATPPVSSALPSIARDAIPVWYEDLRRRWIEAQLVTADEFDANLQSFTLSPCFAPPLRVSP